MKLLVLLVVITVVIKSNCHEISNFKDFSNGYNYISERKGINDHHTQGRSECINDSMCEVLNGTCVVISSTCNGREELILCGGEDCKCCVYGTDEAIDRYYEWKIQLHEPSKEFAGSRDLDASKNVPDNQSPAEIKDPGANINPALNGNTAVNGNPTDNGNPAVNGNPAAIKNPGANNAIGASSSNISPSTSSSNSLGQELEKVKSNMDNSFSNINLQLGNKGCPEGNFLITSSNKCYRLLKDKKRDSVSAKAKCSELGQRLAEPKNPVALRKYLMTEFDINDFTRLDARGNGSVMTWQGTGKAISCKNPLWHTQPSSPLTAHHCLFLMTLKSELASKPVQPYISQSCMFPTWTLCEYELQTIDSKLNSIITNAGTIEAKLGQSEQNLKAIQANMDTGNSIINTELQSLNNSLNNSMCNLKTEIQTLKAKMDTVSASTNIEFRSLHKSIENVLSDVTAKLQSYSNTMESNLFFLNAKLTNQGCGKGTFLYTPSNQCFKFLNDEKRTFDDAKSKCSSLGLQLAHPYDPISLRGYLVTKYDLNVYTWLGARGTADSAIKWQDTETTIYAHANNQLWLTVPSGTTLKTDYCLTMLTTPYYWKGINGVRPFVMHTCTYKYWTLCELVR